MEADKYIKLIIVEFKDFKDVSNRLFEAPYSENIEVGDTVFCRQFEDEKSVNQAVVVATYEINKNLFKDEFEFIVSAAGAELPLPKISAKYVPIKYEED